MMMRNFISFLCLGAVAGTLALGPANAQSSDDQQHFVESAISEDWAAYKRKFLTAEGRIIDDLAGGISHSEGQGYGMVLAVKAGDQDSFDQIWAWTKDHLYVRGDMLAAWKWDGEASPHIADKNNATDGDLLIAWALSMAASKWQAQHYAETARKIAKDITEKATIAQSNGVYLLPGVKGFGQGSQPDAPVINLAYWIFPALDALGQLSPDFPAQQLIHSGLKLAQNAQFGPAKLPANWISIAQRQFAPAEKFPAEFGYDAIRIPLYLAWYSKDYPGLLSPYATIWDAGGTNTLSVIDLNNGQPSSAMVDSGYTALSQLVACSVGGAKKAPVLATFAPTNYYPSTLQLLTTVAVAETYPKCLPTKG